MERWNAVFFHQSFCLCCSCPDFPSERPLKPLVQDHVLMLHRHPCVAYSTDKHALSSLSRVQAPNPIAQSFLWSVPSGDFFYNWSSVYRESTVSKTGSLIGNVQHWKYESLVKTNKSFRIKANINVSAASLLRCLAQVCAHHCWPTTSFLLERLGGKMCLETQLLWVRARQSLLHAFSSISGHVWWRRLQCRLLQSPVSGHSFSPLFLSLSAFLLPGSPALHAPDPHHSWTVSGDGLNLRYLVILDFRLTVPSLGS